MTQSAKNTLMIHLLSRSIARPTAEDTVAEIKKFNSHAEKAHKELERLVNIVRSASDADPNWTEEQICEMIVKSIEERNPGLLKRTK